MRELVAVLVIALIWIGLSLKGVITQAMESGNAIFPGQGLRTRRAAQRAHRVPQVADSVVHVL
jgi:hypothetical protein